MDRNSVHTWIATWGTAAVALFGGAVFIALIAPPVLRHARTHDFLSVYLGGEMARTNPAGLYDAALVQKVQLRVAPESPVFVPCIRPAFLTLAYIPLSWLPLTTAFAVWVGLGAAVLLGIWTWAARAFGWQALVYCAFFLPLNYGILNGQDTAFILGILLLAHVAAGRGKKVLCGVLLGLLLAKFHLFLLVPLVLLVRREWRILAGYVPCAVLAVAISVAMASPRSYLAILTNPSLAAVNPSPEMMINSQALAINLGLDYWGVNLILAAAVLAAVLLIPRIAPWERWFWAAIAGGMLISPHTFEYDAALLMVPILKAVTDADVPPLRRAVFAVAAIPLPYFMTLLPKPFSGVPALIIALVFLAISWPEWFGGRFGAPALVKTPGRA